MTADDYGDFSLSVASAFGHLVVTPSISCVTGYDVMILDGTENVLAARVSFGRLAAVLQPYLS